MLFRSEVTMVKNKPTKPADLQRFKVHQCKICFTIYDEKYGDSVNQIPVGVKFADLPISYCCPVCEAEKGEFLEVDVEGILV